MANILLVTASTHAAATNSKAMLESHGHTVTQIFDANLASTNLASYDLVAVVRPTTSAAIGANYRAVLDAGKPMLIGILGTGQVAGTSGQPNVPHHMRLGPLAAVQTGATDSHSIEVTNGSHGSVNIPNGTRQIFTAGNWLGAFQNSTYVGVEVSRGAAAAHTTAGLPEGVAIEAGTLDMDGVPTAARVFVSGVFYAGQSVYTAAGSSMFGNVVNWLTTPDVSAQVQSAPATATGTLPAPTVDPNAPINRTISAGVMTATAAMPRPVYKDSGAYQDNFPRSFYVTADRKHNGGGTLQSMVIGGGESAYLGFSGFDIDAINAVLRFNITSLIFQGETMSARLHPLTGPWTEDGTTTVSYNTNILAQLHSPALGWNEVDIAAIVDYWKAGNPNHGIAMLRWASVLNDKFTISTREAPGAMGASIDALVAGQGNLQTPRPAFGSGEIAAAQITQEVSVSAEAMQATSSIPAPGVVAEWPINHIDVNAGAALGSAVAPAVTVSAVHDPNFSYSAQVFTAQASMPNPHVIGETPTDVTVLDTMNGSAAMLPVTFNSDTDRTIEAGVMWGVGRLPALFDPYPILISRMQVQNRFSLDENAGATEARNSIPRIEDLTVNPQTRQRVGNPQTGQINGDVTTGNDLDLFGRQFYRFSGEGTVDFTNPIGYHSRVAQGSTGPVTMHLWGAPATVFVFRTEQANANMSNALKLRNGRLYYDGTDQRWSDGGNLRPITDFHRLGSRRYDNGEWHVFTEIRRDRVSIVNPTGGGMLTLQTQARLWFVDGVLDTVRTGSMPHFDFRRLGGEGFVGDIAEIAMLGTVQFAEGVEGADLNTGFFTEHAKHIYNAWFDYTPIFAKPLEGSGVMRGAIGKGNRLRAIGFYEPTNNVVNDQFMTSQYVSNMTDWDRVWTPVNFGTRRTLSDDAINGPPATWGYENGQSWTGHYGDVRVETKKVRGYLDWITGARDDYVKFENPNEWDEQGSYVDLEKYDAIFIVTGPRAGSPSGRREWRERFVRPLMRRAAELGVPVIINDPRVSEDFGVATRHEIFPAGFESYYDWHAAHNIDLPLTIPNHLLKAGEPEKMTDNNFLNRATVASELPGLTDIVDEGRHHPTDVWSYSKKLDLTMDPNYGWKAVKERAWQPGDEIRWHNHVLYHPQRFGGNLRFNQNFNFFITMAYQHMGQPILKGQSTAWYSKTEYDRMLKAPEEGTENPNWEESPRWRDGTLSFIVHAGTSVQGTTLTAPIFVDYTRSAASPSGNHVIPVNNIGPDGEPNEVLHPEWDYIDMPRNRYGSEQIMEWEVRKSDGSGHSGHGDGQNWQEFSKILKSSVTLWGGRTFTMPYKNLKRYTLGDRWLRYMKTWLEERRGENSNFSPAARATGRMPQPMVTADHPGEVTATPMEGKGVLRTPRDLPTTTVYPDPMRATGSLSGLRKGTQPGPMVGTGSVIMPARVLAEGIGLAVYLSREPITVYLT